LTFTLTCATGILFVMLMGLVTISAQRVEGQQQLDALQSRLAVVHNTNRELRADVAEAESPEVVLDAASKLGLVEPGPIVPLEPGKMVPSSESGALPAGNGR